MKATSVHGISGCQQCGRVFGGEMVSCADRARGGCPFACEHRSWTARIIPAGLALLGVYFIVGVLRGAYSDPELPLIIGGFLVFSGLVRTLVSQVVLSDAKGRVRWERNSLLGIKYGESLTVRVPVSDERCPAPTSAHLALPGSQIAVFRYRRETENVRLAQRRESKRSSAIALFQAAFADLLCRELIQVQPYKQYRSTGRKVSEEKKRLDLFSSGPRGGAATNLPASAWLEKSLLRAVNSVDAKVSPDGAAVYDLVRAVFENDRGDPYGWPIEMVEKELVRAGLARQKGFPRRLTLAPDLLLPLENEHERLDDLKKWFHGDGGVEETSFLSDVGRAIDSRETRDNSWS
jgi:hypothetical protein